MLERIQAVYFSPTGGTRRAALCLGEALAREVVEIDLSRPGRQERRFTAEDTVLVAAPVFGGRIPAIQAAWLANCLGGGARAVTAAVYGARAYEDALLELNDICRVQGFRVEASLALVAQHSMLPAVAAGRPDGEDGAWMRGRAQMVLDKLERGGGVSVPGNHPYRQWTPMPVTPQVSDACTCCGGAPRPVPPGPSTPPGRERPTGRSASCACAASPCARQRPAPCPPPPGRCWSRSWPRPPGPAGESAFSLTAPTPTAPPAYRRGCFLLKVQIRGDVQLLGDGAAVLFPLADALGEQVLDLAVHRAEVVLRPGGDGSVQAGGQAQGDLLFRLGRHLSTGCRS